MTEVNMKQLQRDASTGDPKAIRNLSKAHAVEGRDPSCYPWAGDRWRRMHWTTTVVDPCVMLKDKSGVARRHVAVAEAFGAKNEKGRVEHPRDNTGKRVPAVMKTMPWAEWLWLTGTGGFPKPMRPFQANRTPAGCDYKVPPTAIAEEPPEPTPEMMSEVVDLVEEIDAKLLLINKRRFELIGIETTRDLTKEEAYELAELQKAVDKIVDVVTPLPPVPPPPPGAASVPE